MALKDLFEHLKREFQDYPSLFRPSDSAEPQLNKIESGITSYLKQNSKFSNGLTGSINLELNERFSFLLSCDVNFFGTLRAPVISNTKHNTAVYEKFDISKDQKARFILDRCAEDVVRNSMLSLLNLARTWAIDGFKTDKSTNPIFDLPKNHETGFVEHLGTILDFEHPWIPKIHFLQIPAVRHGLSYPSTKMTGPTPYGDDLNAVVYGFHDIHYTVLRTMFPAKK